MPRHGRDDTLSIVVAVLLSLLPVVVFLGLTYRHSVEAARAELDRAAELGAYGADRLLEDGERILTRIAREADLAASPETIRLLSRTEYVEPRFREIGIIDANGALVATNFGPVVPPIPIPREQRSDPADRHLQLVGLFRTALMGERSIILALPTTGEGEVNLLVDPVNLTEEMKLLRIDPDGWIAFVDRAGRVIARLGRAPVQDDRLVDDVDPAAFRAVRRTNLGLVTVVAAEPRGAALRSWWRELIYAAPLAVVCNFALATLLLRHYRRRRGLDQELRLGLRRDEFRIHYQPIVDLASGRCGGVEALLRWRHPRHGVMRPEVFIPVAEKTGILPEITEWVLRRVGDEMGRLPNRGGALRVSVNVAPSQLVGGAAARLVTTVAESSGLRTKLILEITENSLIDGRTPDYQSAVARIRGHGAEFALDDFGVGFSSLESIVALDIRYLKIDKSFIRAIGRDERRVLVLDGLVELAHKLGLDVVAEGIERAEERAYLLARGVRWGQGWLFSPALPAADLERFLSATRPPQEVAASEAP